MSLRGLFRRRPGAAHPYRESWDGFRDEEHARVLIYNRPDEAAFEDGGRSDADFLAGLVDPGDAVLDVGCGIGRVERYLAPRCRELHGIDVSPRMIEQARRRLAGLDNVRLHVGSGRDLAPLGDGSFDAVFSFYVLQHVEREDAFGYLREIARVLRPGGLAALQLPPQVGVYLEAGFFPDVAKGQPYDPVRPRLYSASEAIFFCALAGLLLERVELRGLETVYLLRRGEPDAAFLARCLPVVDPVAALGIHARCFPHAPPAGRLLLGMDGFARLAEEALVPSGRAPAREGEALVLPAAGELVVPLGDGGWTDVVVALEYEALPCPAGGHPDLSLGVRGLAAGPYVQTDSGHAFSLRRRDAETWGLLGTPVRREESPPAPSGRTRVTLAALGPLLLAYDAGGFLAGTLVPERAGPAYLRLVETGIRVHAFEARTHPAATGSALEK